jgi:ferredoxin, 2Fe-2S
MFEILIENLYQRKLKAEATTRPLLYHLQQNYIDWMHACGGKGRCTTCKTIFVKGMENTEPLTPAEQKYKDSGALRPGERLACQVVITGDITIRVPHEGKLPHVLYSDEVA